MRIISSVKNKQKKYKSQKRERYFNTTKKIKSKIQIMREKAILLEIPLIRFLTWIPLESRKELNANF